MKRSTLGLAVLVVLGCSEHTQATIWQVTQLTDNDYSDHPPDVSGSNVVWHAQYGDDDLEILLYDGTTTVQLTNDDWRHGSPVISGANVAWVRASGIGSGMVNELMFYDGTSTTMLESTVGIIGTVHWSGPFVVYWRTREGYGTDRHIVGPFPGIPGSAGVYTDFDGTEGDIFLYDGTSTTKLTDNDYDEFSPQISGSNVVWTGRPDGQDWEIFVYDGTSITQLTHNDHNDFFPDISGSNVVWYGGDGNDYEVFLHDGTGIKQLTDNAYEDSSPQISGSNVVWQRYDGNDSEIFLYDGTNTIQLTDNDYDDYVPKVSGSNVVWRGFDGNDYEIFQATIIPEPSTLALLTMGTLALLACAWRRKREAVRQ
ncbi:MAG: PEP-CTERM sorting domain-containing protein [Planctomycetota bacterium]|jgi:hypothetical protein